MGSEESEGASSRLISARRPSSEEVFQDARNLQPTRRNVKMRHGEASDSGEASARLPAACLSTRQSLYLPLHLAPCPATHRSDPLRRLHFPLPAPRL